MSGGGEPQLMITDRTLYVDGSFPQYDRIFPKAATPKAKALGSASSAVVFGTTATEGPTIVSIGDLPKSGA
jgi:hypothetical protein